MNSFETDLRRAVLSVRFLAAVVLQLGLLLYEGEASQLYKISVPLACSLPYAGGWLHLDSLEKSTANIIFGWLSPLNHATYYMHSFGYDNLPRLWDSYGFFIAGSLFIYLLAFWRVRNYSFNFTGTER